MITELALSFTVQPLSKQQIFWTALNDLKALGNFDIPIKRGNIRAVWICERMLRWQHARAALPVKAGVKLLPGQEGM